MTRIINLSKDYSLDAASLGARGVFTVDDLWACVSRKIDTGVAKVATEIPINREVLLAFLIADALDDPRRSHKPRPLGLWLGLKPVWSVLKKLGNTLTRALQNRGAIWSKVKEHKLGLDLFWLTPKWLTGRAQRFWGTRGNLWPDVVIFVLPLLIIVLGVRAQRLNQSVVQRVAVKPGVTLPALAAIDPQKLITRPVLNEPGTFASIDDLKQRYPSRDLSSGELINDEELLPSALSGNLAGRRLLPLPIKNGGSAQSAQPMDRIKLILTPREKERSSVVIDDAIFLSTKEERETTFVLVAITETELPRIEALLGTYDVFVSQTLR